MTDTDKPQQVASNKRMLAGWIATGWASFFLVLLVTWQLLPADTTLGIGTVPARLVFALAHVFAASLLLFLGFLAVGATRWQIETADPSANPAAAGEGIAKTNLHNRVHTQFLSNTTEQFVMFSAALMAAMPFLTEPWLRLVTVMTILWVFGRLFFWGGYWYTVVHGLPTYPRAIGLGMGLLCTLTLAGVAATGISLHFPTFAGLAEGFSGAGGTVLIQPDPMQTGSNLLPVSLFSLVALAMAALAVFPKLAPPVIPMAVIAVSGWVYLLVSGSIPIR